MKNYFNRSSIAKEVIEAVQIPSTAMSVSLRVETFLCEVPVKNNTEKND